jgi:hypothetical protein
MRALQAFTKLTKQDKRVNVVIASSDSRLPFKLKKMGFKLAHVSQHIELGDIGPDKMDGLLKEWKVRDKMSRALIASYGGHVLTTERAISKLALTKSEFQPRIAMVTGFGDNVLELVQRCNADDKLKDRVLPFLRKLAEKGFVKLGCFDPLGKLATACNVAAFVDSVTETPWVSPDIRMLEQGVVPALQSMRMEIAFLLNSNPGLQDI